jgi:hypothetical protein
MAVVVLAGCTPPTEEPTASGLEGVQVLPYEEVPEVSKEELPVLPADDNDYDVRVFPPDKAGRAPDVKVRPVVGLDYTPTRLSLARPNKVTMVVFAGTDFKNSGYALRKVNELVKKYGQDVYPVEAVGIIMPTAGHRNVANWQHKRKIKYPFYYDDTDMSALKRVARAAGVDPPENFPAVFIVNRHGLIRYYRHGFGFQATSYADDQRNVPQTGVVIKENVPKQYTLENGLRIVLSDE